MMVRCVLRGPWCRHSRSPPAARKGRSDLEGGSSWDLPSEPIPEVLIP